MQASRFWAAGSDSDEDSESAVEETSSEEESDSSSSSDEGSQKKGPSRYFIVCLCVKLHYKFVACSCKVQYLKRFHISNQLARSMLCLQVYDWQQ